MNKTTTVVVDADAIVAQANPRDVNHEEANKISTELIRSNSQVIYPATAIVEAVMVIQRVLNSGATAYGTAVLFTNPNMQVVSVDQDVYSNAVNNYFSPTTSKKNTLFDCIIASIADKYQADAIFSFDKFYKKKGFKLASEL